MQVSATLIAAQQAAREARSRLQMPHTSQVGAPAQSPGQASFASALEKTAGVKDSFAALPLKQTALAAPAVAQAPAQPGARLGMHLDITV